MSRFTRTLILPVLMPVAGMAFGATAAHAQSTTVETAQMHVDANGANLMQPQNARRVFARLQAAAQTVCHSDVSDPMTAMADQACYNDAMRQAVGDLNSPLVTALNDGPKSDVELAAIASRSDTQLAANTATPADSAATPAAAIVRASATTVDPGDVQPGAVHSQGFFSKTWHAMKAMFTHS